MKLGPIQSTTTEPVERGASYNQTQACSSAWLERLSYIQVVAGSNPVRPTIYE